MDIVVVRSVVVKIGGRVRFRTSILRNRLVSTSGWSVVDVLLIFTESSVVVSGLRLRNSTYLTLFTLFTGVGSVSWSLEGVVTRSRVRVTY